MVSDFDLIDQGEVWVFVLFKSFLVDFNDQLGVRGFLEICMSGFR